MKVSAARTHEEEPLPPQDITISHPIIALTPLIPMHLNEKALKDTLCLNCLEPNHSARDCPLNFNRCQLFDPIPPGPWNPSNPNRPINSTTRIDQASSKLTQSSNFQGTTNPSQWNFQSLSGFRASQTSYRGNALPPNIETQPAESNPTATQGINPKAGVNQIIARDGEDGGSNSSCACYHRASRSEIIVFYSP